MAHNISKQFVVALLLLGTATLVLGCAKGQTPPAVTNMIAIQGSGPNGAVEFSFGSDTMCLSPGNEGDHCGENRPPISYPTMDIVLEAFQIDQHEVTNSQYQHCVARGACSEPAVVNALGGGAYEKYYDEDDKRFAEHPVVNITWLQARDYCEFVGKRLPNEYEWEAAARTGLDLKGGDLYPWGKTLEECSDKAVAISGCTADNGFPQRAAHHMADDVILIGTSQELHGMGGNVSEWVQDVYDEDVTCAGSMSDIGCSSAYEDCGGDQGNSFKVCASKSSNEVCDDCTNGTSTCHGMCLESTNPLWVCLPHETPNTDPKSGEAGGPRAFRGGNYATQDRCEARPTHRLDRQMNQSEYKPFVGFRCAKDL